MSSILTNKGKYLILHRSATGSVNLLTDTIKVVLLGTGYTPNPDHNFISDIVANELTGTGYVGGFGGAGRKALANKTLTEDDTNDVAFFDADDSSWTAINAGTAAYAALVKEITNDGDSPVIGVAEINPTIPTNGGDLVLQWAALGLFKW